MLMNLIVLFLCAAWPLAAYTDPGSGAMVWQVLMAGSVAALFYLRSWVRSIRRMFKR